MKVLLSAIQFDPETQPRVQMDLFVVQEYADAMEGGAQFPPVLLFEEGGLYWIGDGFHRCQAARKLGLSEIEAEVKPGGKAAARWESCGANAEHGLRRTNADKRLSVERALQSRPTLSDREIAKHCGVSDFLVRSARPICEILADSREVTRGDQTYIMHTEAIGSRLSDEALELASELDEIRQNREAEKRVEGLPSELQLDVLNRIAEGKTPSQALGEVRKTEAWQNIHLSKTNEWYTPEDYIEAARRVLGSIDVDPASNETAQNKVIHAKTYYTAQDDGLVRDWPGTVWLNPPWGNAQVQFVERLVSQYQSGVTTAAILLVNAHSTDTAWFEPLWDHIMCFTNHRINFYGTDGGGSTHGSVFIYLGSDWTAFASEFEKFGAVVARYHAEPAR